MMNQDFQKLQDVQSKQNQQEIQNMADQRQDQINQTNQNKMFIETISHIHRFNRAVYIIKVKINEYK